jgi:hypothetical protein
MAAAVSWLPKKEPTLTEAPKKQQQRVVPQLEWWERELEG